MFRAICRVMEERPVTKTIYPIHMNLLVRKAAHAELDGFDRLHIIDPLEALDFHNFLAASNLILTDSGGIQEEAPSLGKPVLVMRDTTERPEGGGAAGTLKLVGTDEDVIYREFSRLLSDKDEYTRMSWASNPYGDGHASERIADVLGRQAYGFKRAHPADPSSRCLWAEKRIRIRFQARVSLNIGFCGR